MAMARSARITAVLLLCGFGMAQQAPVRPSFEIASVKLNKSTDQAFSNFPMGPGDVYSSNGGRFSARGLPLVSYLFFAYKITGDQSEAVRSQLPGWATTDRFDIEAKTDGDPAKDTKDQMRLMVQSLLAERFRMDARYETKEVPVFAMTLAKPGKTGPQLRAHPADAPSVQLLCRPRPILPATRQWTADIRRSAEGFLECSPVSRGVYAWARAT